MASRYSQEYLFQHTLMNVSFRNPNGENIREYIHHYASAVFVNVSFWNDQSKILSEIQYEGNHEDYINSYMNFVDMQQVSYNLVTKGKFL